MSADGVLSLRTRKSSGDEGNPPPMQVTRRSAGGETPLQHHAGSIIVEPIMNIVARVGSLTHPSLTFSECSLVGTRRIHRLGVRPERTT